MTKFADLDLDPKVLKAVADAGYEVPTPIQAQAIPHALRGRDVLGIAQTGTGKTAGFVLPMITVLGKGRARARMPRSLVLCPTRELATQVAENFDTYARYTKLTKALLIGGVSFKEQDKLIDRGVDVLIATPGRLLDHFERGKLMLTGVQIMVVDEADRMLDMGFIPDIERIFKLTPFTRQTLFFSATMAKEIERITNEFLTNPARIEVARQATTAETIDQYVIRYQPSRRDRSAPEKRALLRAIIDGEGDKLTNGIVFCNRKRDVDTLAKSLKKHNYNAQPIHGDLDQSLRTKTLDGFRAGEIRLLIASDVAARGLDIPEVSHVFNFDVPTHSEDYVHRIGRTGRAGREGCALTIAMPLDEKYLNAIEALLQREIPRRDSPSSMGGAPARAHESADASEDAHPAVGETPRRKRQPSRRKADAAPAAASVPADTPASTAPECAPPPAPAETPTTTPPASSDDKPSRGRGREPKGGDTKRKPADKVVGMGDHMPDFLTRSFTDPQAG